MTGPPTPVTIGAAFTASGPVVIGNSTGRVRYDPWLCVTLHLARARMVSAVDVQLAVSSPDLTALGSLPKPDFAVVGHNIHTEIDIIRDHASGATPSRPRDPLRRGQERHQPQRGLPVAQHPDPR